MKKNTIINLSQDIKQAIPEWNSIKGLVDILEEARKGEFHCFKAEKYDFPKMALVTLLTEIGDKRLNKIIADLHLGLYDESADEQDKIKLKADWIDSEGSPEDFYKIFGY